MTLDPQRRILRDGSIAIDGSRIVEVGKTEVVKKNHPADRVIDAGGSVVMPGFVDCHAHVSAEPAVKGLTPDDTNHVSWVRDWIIKVHDVVTPDEEYATSLFTFVEMIKTGTTSFIEAGTVKAVDKAAQAMRDAGIRGSLGKFVWDIPKQPPSLAYSTEEGLKATEEAIRKYDGFAEGRVRVWATPLGHTACTDQLLLGMKGLADKYGVGVTLHLSSWPEDVEHYRKTTGDRPLVHLSKIGFLDTNVVVAHAVNVDSAEIEALVKHDAKIAHCPPTALRFGYGITKVGMFPEMLEKGVCVGLGCDSATCSNYFDMGRVVYLAAGLYKDSRQDISKVPAERALEMGTINGARALGMEKEIGSLEKGKKGDLIVFDRSRPEWVPMFNVVNNIVYSADGKSVRTVVIDGNVVMEDYKLTTLDEAKVYEGVQKAGEAIISRAGLPIKSRWPVS